MSISHFVSRMQFRDLIFSSKGGGGGLVVIL